MGIFIENNCSGNHINFTHILCLGWWLQKIADCKSFLLLNFLSKSSVIQISSVTILALQERYRIENSQENKCT